MATQKAVTGHQRAQREIMKHIQYLSLLELQSSSLDPTIPYYNDFHLLMLDESLSDAEIAIKAKGEAKNRAYRVDKIGQAQKHHLDVVLRNTINQAGLRFDGKPQAVAEHREELNRHRVGRLVEIAKDLCDRGNWTESEAEEILEPIALSLGVQPSSLRKAVAEATARAGVWPNSGKKGMIYPPTAPPTPPHYLFKEFSVGRLRMPRLLALMLPMGLVVSVTGSWAGFGYALILLALVLSIGTFERGFYVALKDRNTKWLMVNALLTALVVAPIHVSDIHAGKGSTATLPRAVGTAPRNVPLSETFLIPASARSVLQGNQGSARLGQAADGDTKTAFLTAADGGWLELDYGVPVEIAGVVAVTAKGSLCGGVRRARLTFDGRKSQEIELGDRDAWQVVALDTHLATRVRIAVQEVYSSSADAQACLNEVWFSADTGFDPDRRWAGQWDTNWGRMLLRVEGNWVIGSYQTGHLDMGGRIHLRPEGMNELVGFWCRGLSCVPPYSEGRIRLKLSDDGESLFGVYKEGFEEDMDNALDEFEVAAYTIMGTRMVQK